MKNNNLLITLAVILITVAGLGWFVTSRAESNPAVTQDQVITTPLLQTTTTQSNRTDRSTDYNGSHHSNRETHCNERSAN